MVGLDKPFETESVLAVTVDTKEADQGVLRSLHLHLLTASALFVCFTIAGVQFVRAEDRIFLSTVYSNVIELRFTSKFDTELFIQDVVVNRGNCVGRIPLGESNWDDEKRKFIEWYRSLHDTRSIGPLQHHLKRLKKKRTAKWGQTVTFLVHSSCTLLEVKAVTNLGTFTWDNFR